MLENIYNLMQHNKYYLKCCVMVLAMAIGMAVVCEAGDSARKDVFVSSLVWRADGGGDYLFDGQGVLDGTKINAQGDVEYIASPGTYEITGAYALEGKITSITVNWVFTGKVSLEISTTGDGKSYVSMVNGVPLFFDDGAGKKIKWRAKFAPKSKLSAVKIVYTDKSGVIGNWGEPELSGFKFRKPVYIMNPAGEDLFNFQVPIIIGESTKVKDCDVLLGNEVFSDFNDIRFTATDQQALLAYWRESVTGKAPNRKAFFWVKIPQIPAAGLTINLYYGSRTAKDLSNGEDVFEFFDDFAGDSLDSDKWQTLLDSEKGKAIISGGRLNVDNAKVVSAIYEIEDGVLEYIGKSSGGAVAGIVRQGDSFEKDLIVYSSKSKDVQHCISVGDNVKVNSKKGISKNVFYKYIVSAEGQNITFQRLSEDGQKIEGEVKYSAEEAATFGKVGLFSRGQYGGVDYDWVRVRKFSSLSAAVDITKTAEAEEVTPELAEFTGITVNLKGDLVLKKDYTAGRYISSLMKSPFIVRIVVPDFEISTVKDVTTEIDFSTREDGNYLLNCQKGAYYYASKNHFFEGSLLRWRAKMGRDNLSIDTPSINKLSLDSRSGMITLISPNKKETLTTAVSYPIVWIASEYELNYKFSLAYSSDGGKTYFSIAEKVNNNSRYNWVVPNTALDKGLVKIYDSLNENIYDVSDDYFTIKPSAYGALTVYSKKNNEQSASTGEAAKAVEKVKKSAPNQRPGTSLYDVVFKIADPAKIKGDTAGDYEGELVVITPAGNAWSDTEKNSLLILPAYLTEKELKGLNNTEIVKKKYKVNLESLGLTGGMRKIEKGKKNIKNINAVLRGKHPGKEAIK